MTDSSVYGVETQFGREHYYADAAVVQPDLSLMLRRDNRVVACYAPTSWQRYFLADPATGKPIAEARIPVAEEDRSGDIPF